MPRVLSPFPFPRATERLARATSRPDPPFVWPSCDPQRQTPSTDPGEQMHLPESAQIPAANVMDGTLIDFAGRNKSGFDEFPEPRCCFGVILIVIRTQAPAPFVFGKLND
jgi:hypothetical protein